MQSPHSEHKQKLCTLNKDQQAILNTIGVGGEIEGTHLSRLRELIGLQRLIAEGALDVNYSKHMPV